MAKGRKTGGRLRGTPNKVSAQMRKRITRVLDAIDIESELQMLNAHERVKLWLALIEFVTPKMEREKIAEPQTTEAKFNILPIGTYFEMVDARLKQEQELGALD